MTGEKKHEKQSGETTQDQTKPHNSNQRGKPWISLRPHRQLLNSDTSSSLLARSIDFSPSPAFSE